MRSVKLMYLEICTSQFVNPGSRKPFLPMLPKPPKISGLLQGLVMPAGQEVPVTFVGSNAFGFSQLTHPAVTPHEALLYGSVTTHVSPAPPLPVHKVPRSLPCPVPEISVPCSTVNGRPLEALTIPLIS